MHRPKHTRNAHTTKPTPGGCSSIIARTRHKYKEDLTIMKTFEITFTRNPESGIYSANLVNAETAEQATAYFNTLGNYEIVGCSEHFGSVKPGQPVHTVPDDFNAEQETASGEPFPALSQEVRNFYEQKRTEKAAYINAGYMPTWAEEHRTNADRGIQENLTPAKWAAYTAGTLSREKAVELATVRALKKIDKIEKSTLEQLATVAACPAVDWLSISVNWTRSKTWGYNPHAVIMADNATTEGNASGCGYDKESAAVAQALNDNPGILRILYETAEKALKDGYTLSTNGDKWGDILGYGSGYGILPDFEGGVGCSCFRSIFEKCGYTWKTGRSTSTFNGYTVSKDSNEAVKN